MPSSDVLVAHAVIDSEQVTLRLDDLIGDQPVEGSDGEVYEYLVSETLYRDLKSVGRFGICSLEYGQNWMIFQFLPGMNALDVIQKVLVIVAKAHGKTPFVYLSA